MSNRAKILCVVAKLYGDDAYTLVPFKTAWVAWGKPRTSEMMKQEHRLDLFLKGLTARNRAFVRERLLGIGTVGDVLRCEAYRVYDSKERLVCTAWIDPHYELPVVMSQVGL